MCAKQTRETFQSSRSRLTRVRLRAVGLDKHTDQPVGDVARDYGHTDAETQTATDTLPKIRAACSLQRREPTKRQRSRPVAVAVITDAA